MMLPWLSPGWHVTDFYLWQVDSIVDRNTYHRNYTTDVNHIVCAI